MRSPEVCGYVSERVVHSGQGNNRWILEVQYENGNKAVVFRKKDSWFSYDGLYQIVSDMVVSMAESEAHLKKLLKYAKGMVY